MEYIGNESNAIAVTGGSTDPALFSNPVVIGYDASGRPIYQAGTPGEGGLPIGALLKGALPAVIEAANEIALGWYTAAHQPAVNYIDDPGFAPAPRAAGLTTETILIVAAIVAVIVVVSQ